ncbi:hypothetical protein N7462_008745 [Penicillium macrosclerotiorum]|uniref:uncharacterized protein n=1 Tax=Penicillium macrosclerotiorum TaxID=303699 RepID=UPI0025488786|nr:uncharacterized protein N7462_008745 [Penicillium macrosclerotiorum]KAJ5675848.1 hypothetical protein N7462_008745 [Penicillium macrosclerotiorum]
MNSSTQPLPLLRSKQEDPARAGSSLTHRRRARDDDRFALDRHVESSSPLSSSYQNARARSPISGSSPFLTKTLDGPSAPESAMLSSPLKKSWTDRNTQSPDVYETNENNNYHDHYEHDELNDNDDFQAPASSPFRYDGREDTVDFHKLQEYQRASSGTHHPLQMNYPEEEPTSSPFRPAARDETVDFQRLREVQPMSPGLEKRLHFDEPASSPFRHDVRDETVDFQRLREVQPMSPGLDKRLTFDEPASSPFRAEVKDETIDVQQVNELQQPASPTFDEQPLDPESSPFRPEAREETVDFNRLREVQQQSVGEPMQSPSAMAHSSPSSQNVKDDTINSQKMRSILRASLTRASLGSNGSRLSTATPRKRSFDQTPQDQERDAQLKERCKKGMVNRAECPEIHVDLEEDSSVIHERSFTSAASATQDRSMIANSMMEDKQNEGMSTVLHEEEEQGKENQGRAVYDDRSVLDEQDHDPMDDTGFSNFSVLPDMTSFAKLRADSPLKSMRGSVAPSPARTADIYRRSVDPTTPGTARRSYRTSALLDTGSPIGTPTPRRRASRDVGHSGETPNLLDFTDQANFFHRQSIQSTRYSPSRRSPLRTLRESIRSPSKLSLLDFDIPPAPTPRSIPTITPRELESLKSSFMSEISSLKATLSGKEAEVASLKTAVADAERRVGEALEEVRNEAARKEELELEQSEWDRRGKEMETVLRSVRAELEDGERERDRLARKVEEAEKAKEHLEGRIVELESQLSAARSSTLSEPSSSSGSRQVSQSSAEDTAREVQDAVEKVARELHTLYKSKHETKVAALKKSYESRWEKRVREVEKKLQASQEDNEQLRIERDAAQSETMAAANASMIARENDEHEAEKRVFEAQIKGLQQEMAALKEDSERLRYELKSERAEKGELVAAVDEWLAMQQGQPAPPQQQDREPSVSSAGPPEDDYLSSGEPVAENLNRSIGRSGSSGVRPPATAERRIPRYGAPGGHSRGNSGGKSGIAVFTPGRGGIMSSIERMGRGGAA